MMHYWTQDDLEIDPRTDPLQVPGSLSLADQETSARQIILRRPLEVNPDQIKQMVTNLMSRIRDVPSREAEAAGVSSVSPQGS